MDRICLASLLDSQQQIISKIALGSSLEDCLITICQHIESILDSAKAKSSILLLEGNQLKHGAAPSLPKAYCDAINGVEVGASVGSCGTATYTKKQVIVEDIEHDSLWEHYKDHALESGLRACWSTPIISSTGLVLGSFAIYYLEPKLPETYHLELIERFTHLSSLAIEKTQATERERQLSVALKYSHDKFAAFTNVMPDLALIIQEDGTYTDMYGANELLFLPKEQLQGKNVSNILPNALASDVLRIIQKVIQTDTVEIFEYTLTLPTGISTFEGRMAPMRAYLADDPNKRHVLWMARDITERKKSERRIETLAFYDPLTSLPNRRLLRERLSIQIEKAKLKQKIGALLYIDLDDFKRINDSLGHTVGDYLLIKVAERLKPVLKKTDTIARIGGDEFVVLFELLCGQEEQICQYVSSVAQDIIEAFKENFIINESEYRIGVSIGVSLLKGQEMSADEALKRADTAMYRSKSEGGNLATFFDPSLQLMLDKRLEIEQSLITSIKKLEFCAYFQPQVNLQQQVIGVEALIRWNHPEKGLVPPMEFIPIAEQFGFIHKLQQMVLEEACRLILELEKTVNLADNFRVAINISAIQFTNPHMKEDLLATLSSFGVSPARIKLEITESMLIADVPATIENMNMLRAEGFTFSIDDFGAGYSSLTYLHTFPVDELKIDKSFIDKIHSDDCSVGIGIVDTIIDLAEHLGFKIIAEGVEYEEQFAPLCKRNIDAIQGDYFAKAMPAEQLIPWLKLMEGKF